MWPNIRRIRTTRLSSKLLTITRNFFHRTPRDVSFSIILASHTPVPMERVMASESSLLDLQRFLIKEKVAFLKVVDHFDIYDPDTQKQVGVAQEVVSGFVQILRWFINKKLMPTTVEVSDHETDDVVFTIYRPFQFFRARVDVINA